MKNLISLLIVLGPMLSSAHAYESNADIKEIEKHIRWLVPGDGRINGIAHSYLVKSGSPAGELIIKHVFNRPDIFFKSLDENIEKWLYGTQSNAAHVLAEMGYMNALPTLKEHYHRDVPKYLKNALIDSITMLENNKK